ncbi:MAG: A/G-specific adenine glycosylase [Bacteroidetes bacterium]|nr:A/G-specific adenine glycosylase [Bacteroidota bacterium]
MKELVTPLLAWYNLNKREMPWRDTRDPYLIWISEIMLQQTQVETVRPYFDRFIKQFPDVSSLATANQQQVLKSWEGLGYYSRARNLQKAAKLLVDEIAGELPTNFTDLLNIPGIGPYTAAAIASIAFSEPVPVVDGNVFRVFARINELEDDISRPQTRTLVFNSLKEIIPTENPGDFNQAIMELGALVCRPKQPKCDECPVAGFCSGFRKGTFSGFPVKKKMKERPHKEIAVGLCFFEGKVLIARRHENQMLAGLWEFPGGKLEVGETLPECVIREFKEEVGLDVIVTDKIAAVNHAFTHFTITVHAYICKHISGEALPLSGSEVKWVFPEELSQFPFPKANLVIIKSFLDHIK